MPTLQRYFLDVLEVVGFCVLISLGKKVFVLPACYIICFIDVTGSSGLCSLVSMEVLSAG